MRLNSLALKHLQFFRFVVTGCLALGVNIGTFYLLTEYAHVQYLIGSVLSFLISFVLNFLLQKLWTFENNAKTSLAFQSSAFFLLQMGNLACNTALLYVFVEYLSLPHLVSQIGISFGLAFVTYGISKTHIFASRT